MNILYPWKQVEWQSQANTINACDTEEITMIIYEVMYLIFFEFFNI